MNLQDVIERIRNGPLPAEEKAELIDNIRAIEQFGAEHKQKKGEQMRGHASAVVRIKYCEVHKCIVPSCLELHK